MRISSISSIWTPLIISQVCIVCSLAKRTRTRALGAPHQANHQKCGQGIPPTRRAGRLRYFLPSSRRFASHLGKPVRADERHIWIDFRPYCTGGFQLRPIPPTGGLIRTSSDGPFMQDRGSPELLGDCPQHRDMLYGLNKNKWPLNGHLKAIYFLFNPYSIRRDSRCTVSGRYSQPHATH